MRLTPGCPVIASLSRHPYSLACNALYVILRSCIATTWESPGREPYYKTHAGYCVPVGKRNKQAKDKQLSFTAIVWSKAQFMTRSVQRTLCHCEASPTAMPWQSPGREPYYKTQTINAILSAFTNFRTWSTPLFINTSLLKSNKRELIKISIQFVCKLQSIFFYIPKSTALYFHIIFSCIYIY